MIKDTIVLALETSCDETAAAVVVNGRGVLSSVISSQIPIHRRFGGVVPEIASRRHVGQILAVIDQAVREAGVDLSRIDAVAATYGPGLAGALLVGIAAAKGLAFALGRPLIGVNHLEGHIYANFIEHPELEPPFAALIVSGGHTALLNAPQYNRFELLGATRDDAAGEAFDKIARALALPYPGGPEIEKLALVGDPAAIAFPRAMKGEQFDFSFSGLKSAVVNYLNNARQTGALISKADVAASFQAAVVDMLSERAAAGIKACGAKKIVLAGGVSANSKLREAMASTAKELGASLYYPSPALCTDNAAMIACRAYYLWRDGFISDLAINACPALSFVKT
ncbi:MAG: tRNA (adenosine(37)-N6)-threonylcarbamoyltransferase complex transferase subunit TsaD [Acidaminococcales bacterium]|jgi:N6-L-threonylcarbamoyladenine synthase|nr:tRNA (adenosine(37)-N6)-threonylcarbamoyltransferase complex transferase subunit TsaD [Acidaminococcales bacterium]